jgi:hypothetical protein
MLCEQSTQVANADTKTIGKIAHRGLIQRAILNEPKCALYNGRSSCPRGRSRRGFGSAAQTRPITGFSGFLRCRVIPDV